MIGRGSSDAAGGAAPPRGWWLVVRTGGGPEGVLTLDRGGEEALAVFGSEEKADLFVRSGGLGEEGWGARDGGPRELVRLLFDPFAGARSVALDPSPKTAVGKAADGPTNVSREDFVEILLAPGPRPREPGRERWGDGSHRERSP